jgi:hypothetical protein
MHCRDFKEKHVGFVDDTLAGVERVAMQRHVSECADCARHDAKIRRSLLLVRNLPTIQPSPGFALRLEAKLAEALLTPIRSSTIGKRVMAAATLAAVAMIGYIATTLYKVEQTRDLMLAPVVASVPESEMASFTSPPAAILASAPAGLAIWPAAVFAEQAPIHFARARFATASLTR